MLLQPGVYCPNGHVMRLWSRHPHGDGGNTIHYGMSCRGCLAAVDTTGYARCNECKYNACMNCVETRAALLIQVTAAAGNIITVNVTLNAVPAAGPAAAATGAGLPAAQPALDGVRGPIMNMVQPVNTVFANVSPYNDTDALTRARTIGASRNHSDRRSARLAQVVPTCQADCNLEASTVRAEPVTEGDASGSSNPSVKPPL